MGVTTRSVARRAPYEAVLCNPELQWFLLMHRAMTPRAVLNFLVAVRCQPLTRQQLRTLGIAYYGLDFTSQKDLGLSCDYRDQTLLSDVFYEMLTRGIDVMRRHVQYLQPAYDAGTVTDWTAMDDCESLVRKTQGVIDACTGMEECVEALYGKDSPSIRFFMNRYGLGTAELLVRVVNTVCEDFGVSRVDQSVLDTHPNMLAWADLLTAQPLRAKGHPSRLPCEVPELLRASRHQLTQVRRLLQDEDYTGS